MNKQIFIVLLLNLWVSLIFSQNDGGQWVNISHFEGRFRISAPAEMTHYVDTVSTPVGALAYHTLVYQTAVDTADNVLYMLSYCDYPVGAMHSDSTELIKDFYDVTIEEAVDAVRGKLIYQTEETIQEFPARRWRIHYLNGHAVIKTLAMIVGNRYYSVQTVSRRERALNRSTDRFMDSFHVFVPESLDQR